MDKCEKSDEAYTYHGIIFGLKKENNSATCYNIEELWEHYDE